MKRFLLALLLLAPGVAAAAWSCHQAALALWAAGTIPTLGVAKDDWSDPSRMLELRRHLQKHFLDHAVYVPLEDIIAAQPHESDPADTALIMQKACGRGRLFIWIPFKFKLPIIGEKVLEWCWKPRTKDV